MKTVLQRTLRRQAQEFLEKPFVDRQARLFEYTMSPEERALYEDVTQYLLEPGIAAFQGRQRQLLLLGFHRRMASSTRALAASLERVAMRLQRLVGGGDPQENDTQSMLEDLEETEIPRAEDAAEEPDEAAARALPARASGAVADELRRVEDFVQRANRLSRDDGKFRALLKALNFVAARAKQGKGAGKLVVFTESLVTQTYLRDRLIESGWVSDAEITLFRGSNDSPRAREALRRWREERQLGEGPAPSTEMAMRLALVHEFATRSRILIATEAGAKGLNLQFCDTVVNYDLPWNPQRIEQRIGRCHRYGQTHDTTVINFLASDNEAQQLTYEILSQKLELFGTVLDASDQVLHHADANAGSLLASALGADFELELVKIYDRARTLDEVTAQLRELRERVGEERKRFEQTHARTAQLIEEHLDEDVRRVFRRRKEELPRALAELDRDLLRVVTAYLSAHGIDFQLAQGEGGEILTVSASPELPENFRHGVQVAIGSVRGATSLSVRHGLVIAAVADARNAVQCTPRVVFEVAASDPAHLVELRGRRGRARLAKLVFEGFERVERLVPVIVLEGSPAPLPPALAEELLRCTMLDDASGGLCALQAADLDDACEEIEFRLQGEVDQTELRAFERAARQAERFIEDRLLVLRRRHDEQRARVHEAQARLAGATGSEARTRAEQRVLAAEVAASELEAGIERLEQREDPTFRAFQQRIHERRATPPQLHTLLEMEVYVR